jgi:hypothetical protein
MSKFAENTTVSTEASRMEIERTLRRYQADAFAYATEGRKATILFRLRGRHIRFAMTLPDREDKSFTEYSQGRSVFRRAESEIDKRWEQACRQKWRALALVIKAKLEAVAAGITSVEDEFLAATVLPSGQTVGEWAAPEIEEAYRIGKMPRSLLQLEGKPHR